MKLPEALAKGSPPEEVSRALKISFKRVKRSKG
ncbi:hypothetical protein CCACVL1_23672 [Corchorus capsularis]|uniref:Uncharacterized protein n=1 Tax=Corchorus capsularis TaxID=210143 RepID=A0A1R3GT48_COCAP|nr:hypothetical protein CCACVL1_23672 [Corchorus capsularis]